MTRWILGVLIFLTSLSVYATVEGWGVGDEAVQEEPISVREDSTGQKFHSSGYRRGK